MLSITIRVFEGELTLGWAAAGGLRHGGATCQTKTLNSLRETSCSPK